MRTGALIASAAAVLAAALGVAPAANAATTCTFDPTFHVLSVNMDTEGDSTLLALGPSGDIQVRGHGPVLSCAGGAPTLANTTSIQVVDNSDDPTTMQPNDGSTHVSLIEPSAFTHNGSPIFFVVNLNNGPLDELAALGSSAANQHWVLGDSGMNFNADTSSSAGLVSSTIDRYQLSAGAGNNTISAQGASVQARRTTARARSSSSTARAATTSSRAARTAI